MVEITYEEQNKVKRMERTEDSLRDLWDNIKDTNIRIIGEGNNSIHHCNKKNKILRNIST